jgi:acetolactate synthase-1/2/3 large subunit
MVRQWQQAFYQERYSSSNMSVGMPDFVMLAEAYGVKGMLVSRPEELKDAIGQMLAHEGPVVMNVKVTRDENCYPMVVPGKSNGHMVGLPERSNLQSAELIYCPSCGAKNVSSNKFCPECGTKV